jgi:hypothetical protein
MKEFTMFWRVASSLLVVIIASALAGPPMPAQACRDGCTPINLILSYLPEISNWGPTKATGVVELVMAEGEARGRVTGLPPLTSEVYQAWLVNTRTDETLPFGSFNTDQSQRAQFRFILAEDIPDRDWNLFLVTVEPSLDAEPARQSDKRGIGSFFPGRDQERLLPAELPNTGGEGLPAGGEPVTPPGGPASVAAPSTTAHDVAGPPAWTSETIGRVAPAGGISPAPSSDRPAAANLSLRIVGGLGGLGAGLAAVAGAFGFLAGWLARGRRPL